VTQSSPCFLVRTFEYPELVDEVTAGRLAELVASASGPPLVTATGVSHAPVPAALLAWGRTSNGRWAAGVAFLFHRWNRRALVTVWLPAEKVGPHPGVDYSHVPRVGLVGTVDDWPQLPPCYPQAGREWTAAHVHASRPSPTSSY
jgi:hypothetical protein